MTVKKQTAINRYIGNSTDSKPTGSTVPIGSTFLEQNTSDIYITYDNTNWVKKKVIGTNIRIVKAIKTLEATNIYHEDDILSEDSSAGVATVWTFADVVDASGGAGVITEVQCFAETTSATGDIILDLYVATPTCDLTDHVTTDSPAFSDITASVYLGRIYTPKLSGFGDTAGAVARATPETASSQLPLSFVCAADSKDLLGVAMCPTALGVDASTDMMFALTIEKR